MNKIWPYLVTVVFFVIIDQLTKGVIQSKFVLGESVPVIEGFFNLTYVRNPGAAFGFLANASEIVRKLLFIALPLVACGWLIWLVWSVRNTSKLLGWAYSLILSGALGNLYDRIVLGYVVDFLDFHWGYNHFPAFNIADSAITVAAFLLIYDFIIHLKKNPDNELSSDNSSKDINNISKT